MKQSSARASVLALAMLAAAGTAFLALADDPPPPPPPPPSTPSSSSDSRPFLLIVNTADCKLFTYKMETSTGGHVMLSSHRDYLYDLALDEWPPARGRGARISTSEDVEEIIKRSGEYRKAVEEKKAKDVDSFLKNVLQVERGKGKGKTLVVAGATQGVEADGTIQIPVYRQVFIYVTDAAHKKVLTYMIDGERLVFVGARNVEYDQKLPNSGDFGSYVSFEEIKKTYKAWEKKQKEKEAREQGK